MEAEFQPSIEIIVDEASPYQKLGENEDIYAKKKSEYENSDNDDIITNNETIKRPTTDIRKS